MDRLTSWQRKLIYLGGIVALLIVIIWLGRPAGAGGSGDGGGELARLREEHRLGTATLGQVDPSSATMNLVLLGMRGLAANQLWLQHDDLMKTKNWAQMRAVTDSIVTLQPHFTQVWRFHGWSLAYNVSAEWDLVPDRFFWVKEGAKFTKRGVEKNRRASELPWEMGRMLGHKMGRSDEWMFFRRYFKRDPDLERYKGGQDPEIALSPSGAPMPDNYLAAKEWFQVANRVEEQHGQRMMMRPLFRHYPQRSQFEYAEAQQRDARVADTANLPSLGQEIDWDKLWSDAHAAWDRAYEEWTGIFGREDIRPPGAEEIVVRLETSEAERAAMTPDARGMLDMYLNVTNYRYWRARADLERAPKMTYARRDMSEGQRMIRQGDLDFVRGPGGEAQPPESLRKLREGMAQFEEVLRDLNAKSSEASDQITQDNTVSEEALLAVLYYRYVLELESNRRYDVPGYSLDDFPLKSLWDANQAAIPELRQRFESELQVR